MQPIVSMLKALAYIILIPFLGINRAPVMDQEIIEAITNNDYASLTTILQKKPVIHNVMRTESDIVFYPLQNALPKSFEIFKALIDYGYNPHISFTDTIDPTLLFYTADFEKTRLLLAKGVDVKKTNKNGNTALLDHFYYFKNIAHRNDLFSWSKLLIMATEKSLVESCRLLLTIHSKCILENNVGTYTKKEEDAYKLLRKSLEQFIQQCIIERQNLVTFNASYDCTFKYN